MINAGVSILSYDGSQSFNDGTNQWEGVTVTVHYPEGQDNTSNPPTINDFLLEPGGSAWLITDATQSSGDNFTLTLERLNDVTTENDTPQMGQVQRGAIVSPRNGFIAPDWNSVLVAAEVARHASILTADLNQRENTSDVDKPISSAQQDALDLKLDIDTANNTFAQSSALGDYVQTSELANYAEVTDLSAYAKTEDLGNIATRDVSVSMNNPSGGSHGDIWFKI